eukprot:1321307-Rhodomonas_salina.1
MENLAFVATGSDPFQLVHASISAVSERLKTFRLREHKTIPNSLVSLRMNMSDLRTCIGPGAISLSTESSPLCRLDDHLQSATDQLSELRRTCSD